MERSAFTTSCGFLLLKRLKDTKSCGQTGKGVPHRHNNTWEEPESSRYLGDTYPVVPGSGHLRDSDLGVFRAYCLDLNRPNRTVVVVAEQICLVVIGDIHVFMYYDLYQDSLKQWRWRLIASNGRIIANSGEGYFNKSDCLHAIQLVKGSGLAPVV